MAEKLCSLRKKGGGANISGDLLGLVPVMTSATAPSGEVIKSSEFNNYQAWKAFNPFQSGGWIPRSANPLYVTGDWVGYVLTSSKKAKIVTILSIGTTVENTIYFKIQGYNGSTWIDVCGNQSLTVPVNTTVCKAVTLNNSSNYTRYRLYITANSTSGSTNGLKLQFYGE